MRPLLLAIAIATTLAGAGAAAAQGATISGLAVHDAGDEIVFDVDVCTGHAARLAFTGLLREVSGSRAEYPTRWTVHQRAGCLHWRLRTDDTFPSAGWRARMALSVGGQHLRTGTVAVRGS
jgi:hypothetical protein